MRYILSLHAKQRYHERFGDFPLNEFFDLFKHKSVLIAQEKSAEHRLIFFEPKQEYVLVIVDGPHIITIMLALQRYPTIPPTFLDEARKKVGATSCVAAAFDTPETVKIKDITNTDPTIPPINKNLPWPRKERIFLKCIIENNGPQVYEFGFGKPEKLKDIFTPVLIGQLYGLLKRENVPAENISYLGYNFNNQWYAFDIKKYIKAHEAELNRHLPNRDSKAI